MAGSYKGMRQQYKGKSFGLMLLLAFSAALFGVMVVRKLREKRVLNILLKERDKELSAFQILLQKERDQSQDSRRKTEELKDMIDTLSSQKRELEGWILETKSTISYLKEDCQTKVAALEDRAKEIKTLREREMDRNKKESEEVLRGDHSTNKSCRVVELEATTVTAWKNNGLHWLWTNVRLLCRPLLPDRK